MTVVIDTREQRPLFLGKPPKGLLIQRETLPHGDYSLKGFEDVICIERKRPLEVYRWVSTERDKTIKKLQAMSKMYWKGLLIEGTEDILYHANTKEMPFSKEVEFITKVTPYMVRRALASMQITYNLHIYCAPSKTKAEKWILDRFEFFYKKVREGKVIL